MLIIFLGANDIVVPQQTYKDGRVNKPLSQLCDKLDRTIISMVSASIGPEYENQLLITCTANSYGNLRGFNWLTWQK